MKLAHGTELTLHSMGENDLALDSLGAEAQRAQTGFPSNLFLDVFQ